MGSGRRRLQGLHVLVVEDADDGRELFVAVLRAYGARVTAAASASEALQLLADTVPDVILTDILMPGQDGVWLLDQIRRRGLDCPVVAISGQAEEAPPAVDFNARLLKPVDPATLCRVIGESATSERAVRGEVDAA